MLHREVLALPGAVGGPGLGIVAVDLEVPELGVRDQDAVVDERGADAGAERGEDDQALAALRGAVPRLGEAGGIRVVDDVHVAAGRVGEQPVGVGADPGLVDVGGRVDDAVAHDTRDGDADRAPGVGEVTEQLDEDLGHGVGSGGRGRLDPLALGRELALLEVDRRALDAGAAEVDAERKLLHRSNLLPDPHRNRSPRRRRRGVRLAPCRPS